VRPALQVLQRVTLLLLAAIAVMTVRKGLESLSSANPSVDQAVAAIPRAISKDYGSQDAVARPACVRYDWRLQATMYRLRPLLG